VQPANHLNVVLKIKERIGLYFHLPLSFVEQSLTKQTKILHYLITWEYEVINTLIKSYIKVYLLFYSKCFQKIELDEHSLSSYQGMGRSIKETWFDSRLR